VRRAEVIAVMGQKRSSYKVYGSKYVEKKILRANTFRWKDTVKWAP
jgi:hypothetical protein